MIHQIEFLKFIYQNNAYGFNHQTKKSLKNLKLQYFSSKDSTDKNYLLSINFVVRFYKQINGFLLFFDIRI